MTTNAHTTGPWLIHSGLLGYKGDVFSPTAKKVTDCHHIARCFAPKPDAPVLSDLHAIQASREAIEIIEANARLISAAPDMADALRSIANTYDESYPVGCLERSIGDKARAALAKLEAAS